MAAVATRALRHGLGPATERRSGGVGKRAANADAYTTGAERHDRSGAGELASITRLRISSRFRFSPRPGFNSGPHHKVGDSLNIEPIVPFSLNEDWDLFARPSLTFTYAPTPHEQFGLEDLETSFFLTPAKNSTWIWGVGPIFDFPTASSSELGTGRWSAGPTAALVYSEGPWLNAILTDQLMSFAGDRGRGSVNQTYIEPEISYSFESGWSVDCDPAITYDWTADAANAWTIPMGADIGKAFKLGSRDLSLQAGAYDLLKRPDGAPQWIMRLSVTFLFPAISK